MSTMPQTKGACCSMKDVQWLGVIALPRAVSRLLALVVALNLSDTLRILFLLIMGGGPPVKEYHTRLLEAESMSVSTRGPIVSAESPDCCSGSSYALSKGASVEF